MAVRKRRMSSQCNDQIANPDLSVHGALLGFAMYTLKYLKCRKADGLFPSTINSKKQDLRPWTFFAYIRTLGSYCCLEQMTDERRMHTARTLMSIYKECSSFARRHHVLVSVQLGARASFETLN
jgi:hypothetical protein